MTAERQALLARINQDLPQGRDWKAGALSYLEQSLTANREGVMRFVLTKPLHFSSTEAGLDEARWYLRNFVNVLDIVARRPGARVLDVACGGGWLSHFLRRLGFESFGFDISPDFVAAAKRRLLEDPNLGLSVEQADGMFKVHDIEAEPLDVGKFDFIVLESCLHHFFDPITALANLADALTDDGIVICIEGENRAGSIKDEYMDVMAEFDTIERPYARDHLIDALRLAGLHEVEFMNSVDGWRSPASGQDLNVLLAERCEAMNFALCAKTSTPLDAIVPQRMTSRSMTFGTGAYTDEGTHRWLQPSAELTAHAAGELVVTIILHAADVLGVPQLINSYGPDGLRASITVAPGDQAVRFSVGRVVAGDRITFVSPLAFDPRWNGSADGRLLSFAVTAEIQRLPGGAISGSRGPLTD